MFLEKHEHEQLGVVAYDKQDITPLVREWLRTRAPRRGRMR